MKHISEKDWDLLKSEAEKLGLEVIRKKDIPKGQEQEYIDLSEVDIFKDGKVLAHE